MENAEQVTVQVDLIKQNPLVDQNIGDSQIYWDSCMGDPTSSAGGSLTGTNFSPYYANVYNGVYLTEATSDTYGYLYWEKEYDYKKSLIFEGTFVAGGGSGEGDGITIYFGATDPKTIGTSATDGIAVYFDEYNSDQVKVYKNGSLVDIPFYSTYVLDNYRWRNYTVIYEYVDSSNAFVNVYIENIFVCRVNVGSWESDGDYGSYVGVSAWCGAANNEHIVKSFRVKSGTPWLTMNRK